jgi:hypothetical protein
MQMKVFDRFTPAMQLSFCFEDSSGLGIAYLTSKPQGGYTMIVHKQEFFGIEQTPRRAYGEQPWKIYLLQ